jgi:hypothetical protein
MATGSELASILRDGLASLGLLRMTVEFVSPPVNVLHLAPYAR